MKISYLSFLNKTTFNKEELLAFSWGSLVEDPPLNGLGTLPAPPMLMFDRVTEIIRDGNKGRIVAEQDINLDDWFFQCHFRDDPVQPGCLGVDAVWQLIGFYASLCGAQGSGRALGTKEVEFFGQIRPHNKIVRYEIDIRRFIKNNSSASFVIGSATVLVDGEPIYTIIDAKVGFFIGIQYAHYPHRIGNAMGGRMEKA